MIIFSDLSNSAFLIEQWTDTTFSAFQAAYTEKQVFGNKAINQYTSLILL